jgi:hypothetical protein
MPQSTNYTPISLYYSGVAGHTPLAINMSFGELAINIADGIIFYKNSGGTVVPFSPTTAVTATNLSGGAANRIAYQTALNTTGFLPAPTIAGYVLGWTGSAIDWVAAPAATSSVNLVGGSAGVVPYQSGVGATSFTAVGTAGQVLISNGAAAPTWSTLNALPSQTGNAGKYLSTDGTNASWQDTGASASGVIWENTLVISSNYTLTAGKNGMSVGPITINSGVVVTVPSGQRWVVL